MGIKWTSILTSNQKKTCGIWNGLIEYSTYTPSYTHYSIARKKVIGSWIVNLEVNDDNDNLCIFVSNKDKSEVYDICDDMGDEDNEFSVRLTTEAIEKVYEENGDLRRTILTHSEVIGSWICNLVVDEDNHLGIFVTNQDKSKVIEAWDFGALTYQIK